jgi:hypothetical protein
MDVCDGRVTLGKIVCALSEYALVCIKANKLGIGANAMASGRIPSKLTMSTRAAFGTGIAVGVTVAVGGMGVVVTGSVGVRVGKRNSVGVGAGHRLPEGVQAKSNSKTKTNKIRLDFIISLGNRNRRPERSRVLCGVVEGRVSKATDVLW